MTRFKPHVTVACVIEREGRFLVVEEDRGGPWTLFNQPAGHVEYGEGPIAAALREVVEETAWEIQLTGYLGLYVFQAGSDMTFHSHAFVARPETFLDTPLDPAIKATHWMTLDEIQALHSQSRVRSPLVLQRLVDSRAGRIFPLEVIHE
ncbi:NUDIX hydrolase [Halomonas sp. Bachu 37]|uniref:NUDIX hydrolase n=1 Tax=Halomonas kashgarensis TaxID=3084920 RepID=UPI0032170DF1